MNKDLSKMPVQPKPCKTCLFEGEKPIVLEPEAHAKYVAKIVNLKSQHLCHSAKNKMLCRGGRNILLRVLCGYGLIPEPTDKAFETTRIKVLDEREEKMDIPKGFKQIDVPLPPMLLSMAGVRGDSRFIGLWYQGSKATWTDSRGSATFSFYTVWQPYIEHSAIAIHLFDTHLGADDLEATHVLVCDRLKEKVFVALIEEAMTFLDSQHPPQQPITPQQWEEIKAQFAQQAPLEMSQLQDMGMFEFFMPPKCEHKKASEQLVQWLDAYIDEALAKKYIDAAKAGNYQAIWVLETLKQRYR